LPHTPNWKLADNTIIDEVFNNKNNHKDDEVVTQLNQIDFLRFHLIHDLTPMSMDWRSLLGFLALNQF
jgi:hypothetical protein